ncbi:carboxy-S-adenosyl-L-methionine synthase CmoA [Catenovulum sp. SM1970]|uniref:carboxy-S-adenosyl-L-methionine synthase CmoA n=1 Tax=Marinifaba aquimaris TaxID=2741323 RepID=UPI00157452E4|nr:carboxy-S-adenosyl-L-methionine synthase CmoA [Marinifaba aquimaris]NTS78116.1 carboxy-S-adenosyl-L-methionine synthase CmoA [Marinifaba aquimaris]
MQNPDNIYADAQGEVKDFVFDQAVVDVFPDMIKRSVPGYQTIISTIGQLARLHAQDDANIYDLGCSLGAATIAIRRSVQTAGVKKNQIIGVDNSKAMVEKCTSFLSAYKSDVPTTILCDDILNIDMENASLVVLNFTLQFLKPEDRDDLIARIYQALKPGGILVLSEKLQFADQVTHQVIDDLHLDFKRANGYSELEISQKRTAIENVMRTDTLACHQTRLKRAGFNHVDQWYQCFSFTSFIAIKQ